VCERLSIQAFENSGGIREVAIQQAVVVNRKLEITCAADPAKQIAVRDLGMRRVEEYD
jgi:hypothetical protein